MGHKLDCPNCRYPLLDIEDQITELQQQLIGYRNRCDTLREEFKAERRRAVDAETALIAERRAHA